MPARIQFQCGNVEKTLSGFLSSQPATSPRANPFSRQLRPYGKHCHGRTLALIETMVALTRQKAGSTTHSASYRALAIGLDLRRRRLCVSLIYESDNRESSVSSAIGPIGWYDVHGDRIACEYEALPPSQVPAWHDDLLRTQPSLMFDIGAGTKRDTAQLAARGRAGGDRALV